MRITQPPLLYLLFGNSLLPTHCGRHISMLPWPPPPPAAQRPPPPSSRIFRPIQQDICVCTRRRRRQRRRMRVARREQGRPFAVKCMLPWPPSRPPVRCTENPDVWLSFSCRCLPQRQRHSSARSLPLFSLQNCKSQRDRERSRIKEWMRRRHLLCMHAGIT